jgi:DNA processing protein
LSVTAPAAPSRTLARVNDATALRARLARVPQLDAAALRHGCAQLGSLEALCSAPLPQLLAAGVAPRVAQALRVPDTAQLAADLALAARHGLQLVAATDPHYPPALQAFAGMPAVLWVRGDCSALATPQLAMVGSRHPTALGASTARQFAAWFARAGITITSGLARGIDAACHEGALGVGGLTLAVCGHGLDHIYPPENTALAARIAASGALLSEFPPGTPARRRHFPQRNRLIAALSQGTLVVEAAIQSGSLGTARQAAAFGREVFALPGSIHSPVSRGCHQLIRDGAQLVESAPEVLELLRIPFSNQLLNLHSAAGTDTLAPAPRLDKAQEILLDAVGFGPAGIDDLVARTGLSGESIASMLLILELEGEISVEPGGRYGRRRNMTNTP